MSASGDIIGERYRLLRVLGHGGTSRTWLAADTQQEAELLGGDTPFTDIDEDGVPDEAWVAIKELPLSRLREWKDLDLFEREAEMLAALDHPGIPTSIAHFLVDGAEGATFYLVQEWIDGQNLSKAVKSGRRWNEAQARDLMAQLLPILHYLHSRVPALIHRDVKPSNIIERTNGQIALIDFGAGRQSGEDSTGSTVVGTFGYMPPEQLQGRASPASDIYALAATVCHLLSGKKPADMPAREEAFGIDYKRWCKVTPGFAALLDDMLETTEARRLPDARAVMARLDALDGFGPDDAPQQEALTPRAEGALAAPRPGPRTLNNEELGYAYFGLPSRLGYLALMLLILLPLLPIGTALAIMGGMLGARAIREGYHNAQIMQRGTLIGARIEKIERAGSRMELEYTYSWSRRTFRARLPVRKSLVGDLAPGSAIIVAIDPYRPEDSVPLLGDAAKALEAPEA